MNRAVKSRDTANETNKLYVEDRAVHEWYRFVLSFPAHLVRDYLERFNVDSSQHVLDPFCGTGTVLVECKKLGIPGVGIEVNPMAYFATKVKTDWSPNPDKLLEHARMVAGEALDVLRLEGIEDDALFNSVQHETTHLRTLSQEETKLLLDRSISPLPLHKTLVLLECLHKHFHNDYSQHELLALSKSTVSSSSNLHFGPEVGIGAVKFDAPVISTWLNAVQTMAADVRNLRNYQKDTPSHIYLRDAREISQVLSSHSIDAVITSPPYPNEKDYTRTTRLESVLLGFIKTKADLQAVKRASVFKYENCLYG